MDALHIQMLGEFSLTSEHQRLSDQDNRTRKVWLVLAYLIYNRHRPVPQAELVELLWGDSPRGSNPAGALKTTFHRVRTTLDRLWPTAGHDLVKRQEGGYIWNSECPMTLDLDEFDRLLQEEAASEDAQLRAYLRLLELYQGEFLSGLSSEPWVLPIAAYYHNQYVDVLHRTLPMLYQRGRLDEVIQLCRRADDLAPYNEDAPYYLMRALMDQDDARGAAAVYETFSEQLFDTFGVLPSEELRTLYHQASRSYSHHTLSMEDVADFLSEGEETLPGALMCDYDFFAVVCRSVSRSLSRMGIAAHIALLSVVAEDGGEVSKRSLPRVMENLEEQIRTNLRRGDAAALCSASQYVLMLPQANYENSCMVCSRIIKSFQRKYPHSPASFHFTVYPLRPIT